MSHYFIYKIANTVNDKLYIGMTGQSQVEYRWHEHRSYSRRPYAKCYHDPLYAAMREYGIDKFLGEVIEEVTDYAEALRREQYWIHTLNTKWPNGYNRTARKLTDEQAAIIRYDVYKMSNIGYAKMFGIHPQMIFLIRGNKPYRPYKYITKKDLPSRQSINRDPDSEIR